MSNSILYVSVLAGIILKAHSPRRGVVCSYNFNKIFMDINSEAQA
jgi:hypothetical protein